MIRIESGVDIECPAEEVFAFVAELARDSRTDETTRKALLESTSANPQARFAGKGRP